MPIERHIIKNAYGLSDPKLYGVLVSNHSELLLDGVSMAGYVGVLRLLGDLAQYDMIFLSVCSLTSYCHCYLSIYYYYYYGYSDDICFGFFINASFFSNKFKSNPPIVVC